MSGARTQDQTRQLNEIACEGLNNRQLRMARRVAQKNGLTPHSGLDAVRLLRQCGIDPFARTNKLNLIVPKPSDGTGPVGHHSAGSDESNTPPDMGALSKRDREIADIQQDIAHRRRKRMMRFLARLAVFVVLPTMLAGFYFSVIATPMYATKSEFLIFRADNGGDGALMSGGQFSTSQDGMAVQSYLQSIDVMLRLDADVGFKSHFTGSHIDPLQRLAENTTNENAYKTFKQNVKVGFDPAEGVIRLEVIAPDPQVSAAMNTALVNYAEERVRGLSTQNRDDRMAQALTYFQEAEADRRAAQKALVEVQMLAAMPDPDGVIANLRAQIATIEFQLLEKSLQLADLLNNANRDQSALDVIRGHVRRLNQQKNVLNAQMTDTSQSEKPLAALRVQVQLAQADLATRDMLLQSALQQMEQTRLQASRQVRYLTTTVEPVAPQEAAYPRSFENTALIFLIFGGIYLMVSLTASILREQVTS